MHEAFGSLENDPVCRDRPATRPGTRFRCLWHHGSGTTQLMCGRSDIPTKKVMEGVVMLFCFLSPEPLVGHDEHAANGPLSVKSARTQKGISVKSRCEIQGWLIGL